MSLCTIFLGQLFEGVLVDVIPADHHGDGARGHDVVQLVLVVRLVHINQLLQDLQRPAQTTGYVSFIMMCGCSSLPHTLN